MRSDNFSTTLFKIVTFVMILTYLLMFVMVVVDDINSPNAVIPPGSTTPVPAPPPKQNHLSSILFTGLTTAFAIYTGKILGIEMKKPIPSVNDFSLSIGQKIRKLFASIWDGISKGNLPKIGAALFVGASIIGFFVYVSEVRQVPNFSDEPVSDLLKNLASSFVGLILGVATSGDS